MDALCKSIGAAEPAKSSMPGRLRLSKVQTKCLNYFQSGSNVDPTQALRGALRNWCVEATGSRWRAFP